MRAQVHRNRIPLTKAQEVLRGIIAIVVDIRLQEVGTQEEAITEVGVNIKGIPMTIQTTHGGTFITTQEATRVIAGMVKMPIAMALNIITMDGAKVANI